ncbi:hypothetical protein HBH56_239480 [Parastagonospora nodorum]|uniref:Uncharacterized protein n=2 Tax=Phaeosphaeria nodorum (strain SN15 / ATCC MYA-4574 / FGSC 10173) TaxID=321614 RepID=A0A7U2ID43_PHANO|nr:hypothetical protein SNOG_16280 [Parastagonospora nodorum SN15]KAH3904114.1 hypothetical protein HBH56_239480 [Parastagonospora nodorum]EAT76266.1 hypothetical protein SNOG_16280 [Parastagonospora nodorum SN15]KAH3921613.1 hypothetical protein HBH54_236580 [Parastagonospora nodorum]KAH3994099.1 hypothetical protein HBI10_191790 [Parastagonospora nodorum]KAH4008646.1 hypothetical protein HBI13_234110 [Parastagonospora nodorum]
MPCMIARHASPNKQPGLEGCALRSSTASVDQVLEHCRFLRDEAPTGAGLVARGDGKVSISEGRAWRARRASARRYAMLGARRDALRLACHGELMHGTRILEAANDDSDNMITSQADVHQVDETLAPNALRPFLSHALAALISYNVLTTKKLNGNPSSDNS